MIIKLPIRNDVFWDIQRKASSENYSAKYPHITAWSEDVYDVHVNGTSVNGFYIKGEEAKITWFLLQQ